MNYIRKEQLDLIPNGDYCHEEDNTGRLCPFWTIDREKPSQTNGVCLLFGYNDWEENAGFGLLWDQVKICTYNLGV